MIELTITLWQIWKGYVVEKPEATKLSSDRIRPLIQLSNIFPNIGSKSLAVTPQNTLGAGEEATTAQYVC